MFAKAPVKSEKSRKEEIYAHENNGSVARNRTRRDLAKTAVASERDDSPIRSRLRVTLLLKLNKMVGTKPSGLCY